MLPGPLPPTLFPSFFPSLPLQALCSLLPLSPSLPPLLSPSILSETLFGPFLIFFCGTGPHHNESHVNDVATELLALSVGRAPAHPVVTSTGALLRWAESPIANR